MPCPFGVDILECFSMYNQNAMFNDSAVKFRYLMNLGGIISNKPSHAKLCTNCGKCVKKCPQKLPIPKLLKDVSRELGGKGFNYKVRTLKLIMPIYDLITSVKNKAFN
jgi:predicted aldo/keto reductase-like oxidoreductase